MDDVLGTLAFALLIGAQFLAAVVLISQRKAIYAEPGDHVPAQVPQPAETDQHIAEPGQTAKAA
jgi:hypothetical protein